MPKAAGFPPASKILQKYEKDRAQKLHRQKVSNMKAKLNNSPPKTYPHLQLRTKKLQQDETEQARIEHDNRLLLEKMSYIMRHQGRVDNWNDYEQRSLNNPYRERQLENIAAENVDIAKRLEKIQPLYDIQEWEDDFQRHEYYLELWAESSKDYQGSTPRNKNKEKESRQEKYDDDFDSDHGDDSQQQKTEGDDSQQQKTEGDDADSVGSQKSYHDDGHDQKKLPKIDNKQKDKNKSRSDSKVTKLPKIDNGTKQHNKSKKHKIDHTRSSGENETTGNGAKAKQSTLNNHQKSTENGDKKSIKNDDQQSTVNGDQQSTVNGDQQSTGSGDQQLMVNGNQQSMVNGNQQSMVNGDQQSMVNGDQQSMVSGDQQSTGNGSQQSTVNSNHQQVAHQESADKNLESNDDNEISQVLVDANTIQQDDATKNKEVLPSTENAMMTASTNKPNNGGKKEEVSTKNEKTEKKRKDSTISNEIKHDDSPEGDAKLLFKVCKQMVKDEDQAIIKALAKKSYNQRMQTKAKFREMYDLDLEPELKTGLGRDWDVLIEALLAERESSDADALHDALEGNNISAAVEILCTRNNSALASIKEAYQKEYAVSLESDISDKTDDPIQVLLLTLQKGDRVETTDVNEKAAEKDAEALYEFGDGRWTSESGKFLKLLNEQSLPYVRTTLNLYKQVSGGKDVHESVKDECDKDYANALKTLINCVSGPHIFYADKLYKNMSATDPAFVNTLVTRSEMDLPNIKKTYKKKYDAELVMDMKENIDHPTKKVLIELANKAPPQGKGKNKKQAGMSIVGPPKKQPMKKPGQKDKKGDSDDKTNNSPFAKPSRTKTRVQEKNESLDDDVERLRKAMKGLGTDEDVIIEILTQRSNQQRQEIQNKYNEKYKRDLTDDLKSELSGDFEEVIVGLMKSPVEYDAFCLHEAMAGVGTSEATLIGILCTRNSQDLKKIKEQYKKDYNAELEADVKGDTSGGFQDLLLSILGGDRDAGSSVNQEEAKEDAKALYQNEKAEITADNETFQKLMTKKNSAQVKATSEEYHKISGSTLQQAITKGMSGDDEDAYVGLVNALDDPIEFYASRLHGAFSGLGTNDNMLIRIVISHAETDLPEIKAKYKELYGKTLTESIKSECSGDYKKALLVIVGDK